MRNRQTTRVLQRMLRYSFKVATRTIVLDRFMKERVVAKHVDPARIAIIPPWSHDDHVGYSASGKGSVSPQARAD